MRNPRLLRLPTVSSCWRSSLNPTVHTGNKLMTPNYVFFGSQHFFQNMDELPKLKIRRVHIKIQIFQLL